MSGALYNVPRNAHGMIDRRVEKLFLCALAQALKKERQSHKKALNRVLHLHLSNLKKTTIDKLLEKMKEN